VLLRVPLSLILPDQPNRAVWTRMLRGVGGGSCEAPPYPDGRPQNANSRCNTEITSIWVSGLIEPSFFMSRFLSIVRI